MKTVPLKPELSQYLAALEAHRQVQERERETYKNLVAAEAAYIKSLEVEGEALPQDDQTNVFIPVVHSGVLVRVVEEYWDTDPGHRIEVMEIAQVKR
jgi:hypothetical protein